MASSTAAAEQAESCKTASEEALDRSMNGESGEDRVQGRFSAYSWRPYLITAYFLMEALGETRRPVLAAGVACHLQGRSPPLQSPQTQPGPRLRQLVGVDPAKALVRAESLGADERERFLRSLEAMDQAIRDACGAFQARHPAVELELELSTLTECRARPSWTTSFQYNSQTIDEEAAEYHLQTGAGGKLTMRVIPRWPIDAPTGPRSSSAGGEVVEARGTLTAAPNADVAAKRLDLPVVDEGSRGVCESHLLGPCIVGGVGLAALGASLIVGRQATSKQASWKALCPSGCAEADLQTAREQQSEALRYGDAATVLLVGGATVLVSSAIWYLWGHERGDDSISVESPVVGACSGDRCQLWARGQF